MKRLYIIQFCVSALIAALFCCSTVYAQLSFPSLSEDARLFSPLQTAGTARLQGFGGAGISLGGDVGAGLLNPAGLGFYNRSSLVFTPGYRSINTNTSFEGTESSDLSSSFGISSFGLVIANTRDETSTSQYRGGAFAVTFNRINTFDYANSFRGPASEFSIIDDLTLRANGVPSSDFDNELGQQPQQIPDYLTAAYNNFLINPVMDGDNTYRGSLPVGTRAQPSGDVQTSGRLNQWNFSYGGNFDDKLYLGASVGLMSFSQERLNEYREEYIYSQDYVDFINDGNFFFPVEGGPVSIDYVSSVQLNETQEIQGTGINANLGVIYRPIQALTVGLSFLTPTAFSIEERSFFDLSTEIQGLQQDSASQYQEQFSRVSQGNEGTLAYNLKTPARVGVGASYFFQNYGFLTADVEYVNYPGYRFSTSENNASGITSATNEDVARDYQSVINYRVGGEFRYDVFRFRLGYAFYKDPTSFEGDTLDRDRQSFSGGVGVITESFFADLSVVNNRFNTDARPYGGTDFFYSQENSVTNIMLSLGFNF